MLNKVPNAKQFLRSSEISDSEMFFIYFGSTLSKLFSFKLVFNLIIFLFLFKRKCLLIATVDDDYN